MQVTQQAPHPTTLSSLGLGLRGDSQNIWLYLNHPAQDWTAQANGVLPLSFQP